ncbi:MAG TPA: HupE/UreJ family protein [Thermoanaerobaculia bacterium]|jgi:hypothetical protein|nr:HupE/UreJ family protein [Thermoanaerobaculia bacterium]
MSAFGLAFGERTTMCAGALLALAVLLFAPVAARAHQASLSYATLTVAPHRLTAEVSFTLAEASRALGLDHDGDGQVSASELRAGAPAAFAYLAGHVRISADYTRLGLRGVQALPVRDPDGQPLLAFRFAAPLAELPGELAVHVDFTDRLGARHVTLTKVMAGGAVQETVLAPQDPTKRFPVGGELPVLAQVGAFVRLGVEHIFLGYDHIMFLLGLILLGGRLRNLIKIVTSFTVAHSVTLILAATGVVVPPVRLIESAIALSIVYVAAENFWLREAAHRWILTFFFGLVHGFGFANVLHELGLPSRGLIASLLSFNVGVEIGQICIVGLLFPLTLWLARQHFQRRAVLACSGAILLFGAGWLVERAFGFSFMPF